MACVTVGKWGKNLAVRLPADIVRSTGLNDGESVDIDVDDGTIVIHRRVPRFTPEDLFRGKSAADWRAIYAGAYDWGPDIGQEIIEA